MQGQNENYFHSDTERPKIYLLEHAERTTMQNGITEEMVPGGIFEQQKQNLLY